MNITALQRQLREFAVARDWQSLHCPKNLAMALMVEAAELQALYQWLTPRESVDFGAQLGDRGRVADEVADVLIYLLQFADHAGIDVEQAVEHKLRKNAEKYPARHPEVLLPPTPPRTQVLVDWENVQPSGEALRALIPDAADVWLFHGPQQKVDTSSHERVFGVERVTLVPRSGNGKNALDFHLAYYVGYLCARKQPQAFVVVSNDQGYDPMLEHAREVLGFDAKRHAWSKSAEPKQDVVQSNSPAISDAERIGRGAWSNLRTMALADRPRSEGDALSYIGLFVPPSHLQRNALLQDVWQWLIARGHLLAPQSAPQTLPAVPEKVVQATPVGGASKAISPAARPAPKKTVAAKPAPAKAVPGKKAAAKQAVAKAPTAAAKPAAAAKTATPAKLAQRVLTSLKKMGDKRPKTRTSLLKHIATHVPVGLDRAAVAEKVWALLQSQGRVQQSAGGAKLTYGVVDS
ncbi:PIN domain-containing protein [Comamonas badia]|uniref:PIN domain-containing protein n=1 Tax=Comamonas badia TaxID=265291 RepID=UPI0003F9E775